MVVIFAGILIYTNYQHNKAEQALRDEIQRQNHLITEDSTLYSKVAEEKNSIAAENKDLKALLKSRDEAIKNLTKITLTQDSIIFALQQGTVIHDTLANSDSLIIKSYQKPYHLLGYALFPSGKWSLKVDRDPINLVVYYTQTKFGNINRVYIDTQDSTLKVSNVKVYKAKEKKSIFKTFRFDIGAGYSKKFGPGLMGGLGLGKYSGGVYLYQDSYGVYFLRSF
jgi:hypothetical protein